MTARAPWLSHYDPGVPASLAPYPTRSLLDYVSEAARQHPSSPAVFFKGAALAYGELEPLSDACATALADLGVSRGDRIALLLPNCPQFLIVEIAAWKLGAIVAPLNPTYTESELEGPLREHGVETIVTLTRFYERVNRVQPKTPVTRVIATNIKEYFPPLLRFLFTVVRERKEGDRVQLAAGDHALPELLAAHRGRAPQRIQLKPHDPAVLLMSGGTTGTPKGVLGTHGAYVMAGLQVKAWNQSVLGDGDSPILLP